MEKQSLLNKPQLQEPKPDGLTRSRTRMFKVKKTMIAKKRIVVESNHAECYTLKQFVGVLKKGIADVNTMLSLQPAKSIDRRISFSGSEAFEPKHNDLVFGFSVKLLTNSWTYSRIT